jgi:hypothetical protein
MCSWSTVKKHFFTGLLGPTDKYFIRKGRALRMGFPGNFGMEGFASVTERCLASDGAEDARPRAP